MKGANRDTARYAIQIEIEGGTRKIWTHMTGLILASTFVIFFCHVRFWKSSHTVLGLALYYHIRSFTNSLWFLLAQKSLTVTPELNSVRG